MVATNNDGSIIIGISNDDKIWYAELEEIIDNEEEEENLITEGIKITSASYGANCNDANEDNQLKNLASICDGKYSCQYKVNTNELGDPSVGCAKTYGVSYTCDGNPQEDITLEAEANGKTLNITCPIMGEKDSNWTLLFRQTAGTYLTKNQWLSHNLNNPDSNNYSRLIQLNDSYRDEDGKFIFKLVWPEHELPNQNIWSQTSNPIKKEPIAGYEAIDINYTQNGWGGLVYSGKNALLDGSVDTNQWWYAIGSTTDFAGGIPGGGFVAKKVEWAA